MRLTVFFLRFVIFLLYLTAWSLLSVCVSNDSEFVVDIERSDIDADVVVGVINVSKCIGQSLFYLVTYMIVVLLCRIYFLILVVARLVGS